MVAVLEVGILALIASPVLRAAMHPSLRRAFPRTAGLIGATVLLGIGAAAALAVRLPQLLHLTTGLALGGTAWAVWEARPNCGRSRRLPPGSLSLLPFGYLTDPFYLQRQIDRYGPIFKMNQFGIGAGPNPFRGLLQPVCGVSLERGIAILHEHDACLMPPPIPSSRFIPKRYLREMAPDDHARYRQLFSAGFTRAAVDGNTACVAGHIRTSLLRLVDMDAASGGRGVAPEEPLVEMMFAVFLRYFCGIAPEDDDVARLRTLFDRIDLSNRNEGAVRLALEEIGADLRRRVSAGTSTGNPAPPSFLRETARADPDAFADLTVLRNFIYILQASWIDTAGLVVWLFKELGEHPQWLARIRDAGDRHTADAPEAPDALSLRCVRETLRLRQSEYLYRKVLADIPIDGFVIPEGWLLRVYVRESHRDPKVFAAPDTFNPDRFLGRRPAREAFSPFGASRISCLGDHLTLAVGRVFAEQMAGTIYTSTLRDGPLEFRRWHWKPSSTWRVQVRLTGASSSRFPR